jgi:hypothetical protein
MEFGNEPSKGVSGMVHSNDFEQKKKKKKKKKLK